MIIFQRKIESQIKQFLWNDKAVLIFGPRQAGKTTLSKKILTEYGDEGEYFNCELISVRKHFEIGNPDLLLSLIGTKKIVVFDEAQTIENIGKILKVFIDTYPNIQIIATGSSSFDLANKINEPLTGRSFEFTLYPLSLSEIRSSKNNMDGENLSELMRLGSYPAVVAENNMGKRESALKNLTTNYLYKDVFTFGSIKNPAIFEKMIKMLALQIGSLVSVNELSRELGTSRTTVDKYLRLLEQAYIIKTIRPFSRNKRNEIKKAFKVYFIDVGVRNAVIDDISSVGERDDKGPIFENFFIMERLKESADQAFPPQVMFWRDRQGNEVDIVEEKNKEIKAFECKWNKNNTSHLRLFKKRYPEAVVKVISPDSLLENQ